VQGNNNQVMTYEESLVLKRSFARLRFCDVCGEQIFNDGHIVFDGDLPVYCICDDCHDSWVHTLNS
jgi:hypothetical protein